MAKGCSMAWCVIGVTAMTGFSFWIWATNGTVAVVSFFGAVGLVVLTVMMGNNWPVTKIAMPPIKIKKTEPLKIPKEVAVKDAGK